jgi:hypothetical protein
MLRQSTRSAVDIELLQDVVILDINEPRSVILADVICKERTSTLVPFLSAARVSLSNDLFGVVALDGTFSET